VKIRQIGKKHKDAKKKVDDTKVYVLTEAVALLKKIKYANFDESVELHLNVIEDGLKGEVELPNSTGKTVKVKIVDDKVIEELEKGVIDFDVLVTHPSFMPKLAKFARTLGPKGLMPNPKAGTVSPHPEEVVKKFEKGVLRWKTEPKFPLVHQLIAKGSHEDAKIVENAKAFITAVGKGHISAAYIKTTMSPALMIDLNTI
jgi:large subunit ribosomal protein L1